jgi:hypothetical protein
MRRRAFLELWIVGAIFGRSARARSEGAAEQIERQLLAYEASVEILEQARSVRETGFRDQSVAEAQVFSAAEPSKRVLNQSAYRLILASEVSSEEVYASKYTRPVWPGGNSGVTIGIGYDLGDKSVRAFKAHWLDILTNEQIRQLREACRLSGENAKTAVDLLQDVEISWDVARTQFGKFLPIIMGETEAAFPNCDRLNDMSFGALVSLVYNRGSNTSRTNDRRREMFDIKQLMQHEEFSHVPACIRSMKRLWEANPMARGLLLRRELEAQLFEAGLSETSAEKSANVA